jgi:carboxyl-terminal processing protease
MKSRSFLFLLVNFLISLALFSCREKEAPAPSQNEQINTWIKEVMDEVYLWLDEMKPPIAKTSEPEDYFESLLNRPTDRFSAIYPDYQTLINSLQGISKEAGYEFALFRESNENENVIALINYTKKNSPAANAGLKRGDVIFQINGTILTVSNYRALISAIDKPHSVTFRRFDEAGLNFVPQPTINLEPVVLAENPNFLDTVYTIGNHKIGYVVYHFFAPGIDEDPKKYDAQMENIFGKFKAQGINHLIVDFRYNSGGYVSSAVNLASLIAPGVSTTDVFSKTRYNSFLMGFPQLSNVQTTFAAKSQNLGPILTGNRVYILTSRRTASASELIINGLKPYMDVFLIGEQTVGKNVGSIAIEDEENADNKYGLLPIVSRSYNKDDRSDYATGFPPNIPASEASQRRLLPLGDTNEYMLRVALGQITDLLPQPRLELIERLEIGSSLQRQTRFGRMIEDKSTIQY